jgi:hypothetical protein
LSIRLGISALALGLVSILILCVPILGYLSLGLSGIGLMLGVTGLYLARKDGVRRFASPAAVQVAQPLGGRELNYQLGGILVCLLAATLVLLPILLR